MGSKPLRIYGSEGFQLNKAKGIAHYRPLISMPKQLTSDVSPFKVIMPVANSFLRVPYFILEYEKSTMKKNPRDPLGRELAVCCMSHFRILFARFQVLHSTTRCQAGGDVTLTSVICTITTSILGGSSLGRVVTI